MVGGRRRSSFQRFSGGREVTSFRDHHSMRDNPSISVSIAKEELTSRNSVLDGDAISRSSRTNSRLQSYCKSSNMGTRNSVKDEIHEVDGEDSFNDSKGEYSPVHRYIKSLTIKPHLKNPFNEDENNDESLMYLKIDQVKSNTVA